MRVAAFAGDGGPRDVEVREMPDPEPGPGEAVVEVAACSLNRHDLWILQGDSVVEDGGFPFVSGVDVAGVVAECGEDVAAVQPGDRVVRCPNLTCGACRFCRDGPETLCETFSIAHGGLAERVAAQADRLVALPDGVPWSAAAALPGAYATAWRMLRRAGVVAGDLVLVPGATGGLGVAAVQLCDVVGARSVGTSRSGSKLERLSTIGADHTVRADDPDAIEEAVADLGPVDAVVDHLGGEFTEMGLRVLRRGGRLVVCGRTAGTRATVSIPEVVLAQTSLVGSNSGTQADLERLVGLVAGGDLDPVVDREYDLAGTRRAFERMRDREVVGKLVVRP